MAGGFIRGIRGGEEEDGVVFKAWLWLLEARWRHGCLRWSCLGENALMEKALKWGSEEDDQTYGGWTNFD